VFGAEPGHGLSQNAVKIEHWGGFITNSMVVSWVVAIILIIFARVATRNMKGIPGGAQNLLEWLVESLYDFLEKIIGPHLVKRTFWFLATIFIFILSANWFGLIPGVGTIGWGQRTSQGFVIGYCLFRLLDHLGAAGSGPDRAEARLKEKLADEEVASINASLARSLAQLRVKRRHHK